MERGGLEGSAGEETDGSSFANSTSFLVSSSCSYFFGETICLIIKISDIKVVRINKR